MTTYYRNFRMPAAFKARTGMPDGPGPWLRDRADLRARLSWAHGESRASEIMDGEDELTNEDVGAWHRLCWRAGRLDDLFS